MSDKPSALSLVRDIANIVTLLGLSCGVLGIYFALQGNFPAAVIAMLWAVLFDWYDGPVARQIPGRSDVLKAVGSRMDSLVDIVSLAICPAITPMFPPAPLTTTRSPGWTSASRRKWSALSPPVGMLAASG